MRAAARATTWMGTRHVLTVIRRSPLLLRDKNALCDFVLQHHERGVNQWPLLGDSTDADVLSCVEYLMCRAAALEQEPLDPLLCSWEFWNCGCSRQRAMVLAWIVAFGAAAVCAAVTCALLAWLWELSWLATLQPASLAGIAGGLVSNLPCCAPDAWDGSACCCCMSGCRRLCSVPGLLEVCCDCSCLGYGRCRRCFCCFFAGDAHRRGTSLAMLAEDASTLPGGSPVYAWDAPPPAVPPMERDADVPAPPSPACRRPPPAARSGPSFLRGLCGRPPVVIRSDPAWGPGGV